jgi:2-haloacid dehalogenase
MAERPLVVAFDVFETLFPLEPMRARLVQAGLPETALELWFARILRDGFALAAAGGFQPFTEVAASALVSVTKGGLADSDAASILAGFRELDPHADAEPALRAVRDAGVRAITLTNGSVANTGTLLRRADLDGYVERTVSIDDAQVWKPAPRLYLFAADTCGVQPAQLALVAAHSWDIHGARNAGLSTGWVSRLEGQPPRVFGTADVSGPDLVAVVTALLALPGQKQE